MRVKSRLVLGLCGLALSGPATTLAWAAPQEAQQAAPAQQDGQSAPAQEVQPAAPALSVGHEGQPAASPGGAHVINLQQSNEGAVPAVTPSANALGIAGSASSGTPVPAAMPHHHHGLLGRRHCVECQRARIKAADGVDVPPPPGYPGGAPLAGHEAVVSGPVVISERVIEVTDAQAPGHAIVGGPESAAGYAVVGGEAPTSDPAPIGMARGATPGMFDPRMAAAMGRPAGAPGSYDPSVMPSSIPPAQQGLVGTPDHKHTHAYNYVKAFFGIGRIHDERAERQHDKHASIAYEDPKKSVTELPASMVYSPK